MPNKKDPYFTAQDILSRRDHSEAEMRQKLRRKRLSREEIDRVVNWLHERGLLDDKGYAGKYIESVLSVKPVGPKWLQAKLRQRGVDSAVVNEALDKAYREDRESLLAGQAAAKWMLLNKDKDKKSEKLSRFLLSRGFSYNAVMEAVDLYGKRRESRL